MAAAVAMARASAVASSLASHTQSQRGLCARLLRQIVGGLVGRLHSRGGHRAMRCTTPSDAIGGPGASEYVLVTRGRCVSVVELSADGDGVRASSHLLGCLTAADLKQALHATASAIPTAATPSTPATPANALPVAKGSGPLEGSVHMRAGQKDVASSPHQTVAADATMRDGDDDDASGASAGRDGDDKQREEGRRRGGGGEARAGDEEDGDLSEEALALDVTGDLVAEYYDAHIALCSPEYNASGAAAAAAVG